MPHTDAISVDNFKWLWGKTGIYTSTTFQMSKTNSLKITRMFTLFINKAFNNSNYIHLPSLKNTHSCFHIRATD